MYRIDCLELISDPQHLKMHLKDNTSIVNLSSTSSSFYLKDGIASLQGHHYANPMPWLSLLDHKLINTIELKGFNADCLTQLPDNVKQINFHNYRDLNRVRTWLHDESLPTFNRIVDYKGGYSGSVPVFEKPITKAVTHLILPLNQDINLLIQRNAHLQTFGFDFDHQRDLTALEDGTKNFVLWSSHKHNHNLSKQRYPQHQHRLHYL